MALETGEIPIHGAEDANAASQDLFDAIRKIAKARSTSDLIKVAADRSIHFAHMVPLSECYVDATELDRTLRSAYRAAAASSKPGDQVMIEFILPRIPASMCRHRRINGSIISAGLDSSGLPFLNIGMDVNNIE